jgi:hypothetical protein
MTKTYSHALTLDGVRFMEGGRTLVAVVFNRINGSAEASVHAHKRYLALIGPSMAGGEFQPGQVVRLLQFGVEVESYTIGSPVGATVGEDVMFGKWLAQFRGQEGAHKVARANDYLLKAFRVGLSPMDALRQGTQPESVRKVVAKV